MLYIRYVKAVQDQHCHCHKKKSVMFSTPNCLMLHGTVHGRSTALCWEGARDFNF